MLPLRSRVLASLTAVVLLGLGLPLVLHAVAAADGTPDISLTKTTPGEVRYGDTAAVSLTASNAPGAPFGYNLSFRDVLPAGVSYVDGSGDVAPTTILVDQPVAGQTTLIWENVSDLAPANSFTLGFEVEHTTDASLPDDPITDPSSIACADDAVLCVGETYENNAGAYVNSDPRYIPDFDPTTGEPVEGITSFTGFAVASAETTLVPFLVEKDEPNTEGEILRGVHDHDTTYTITVRNNFVRPTTGLVIEDFLPAGLEFLGCGGVDNTTDAPTNPGSALEYPGAAALTTTPAPTNCVDPTEVETVEDPAGLPAGVYTRVRWTGLGDIAIGADYVLTYAAGIPIRENTMDWNGATAGTGTAPTVGGLTQTANLDNNSGAETTDEQALTNEVTATGTFDGAATLTPGATSSASTELTRTAEDLSVHKSVSSGTIDQGDIVTWSMLIETSEYRYVDDVVVTDTLPDGLCPLGATNFEAAPPAEPTAPPASTECDPTGDLPSAPYTSAVESASGSWTLTWDSSTEPALGRIQPSSSVTIDFPTRIRTYYQENFDDDVPVVGRDAWNNTVSITGDDFVICAPGTPDAGAPGCTEPGAAKIDADEADGSPDADVSGAGQEAQFDQINKFIAAPVGADCTDGDEAWQDDTGVPALEFAPGDRICYRLTVDFDPAYDTRNPLVDDFIPPNTTFDAGSAGPLVTNTVALQAAGVPDTSLAPKLTWLMGVDAAENPCDFGVEDCFAQPGERFDVAFSVTTAADPSVGNDFDLVDNLMKFAAQNTAGTYVPLRDAVTHVLVEPVVGIAKAATDDTARSAGDTIDYEVTVTNTGNEPALDVEVWDVLPDVVVCADDVTVISGSGACHGTENRIEWTIPALAATGDVGDSVTLTYTVTVPIEVAAGESLDNTAGVRTYQSETNLGGRVDYFPADNIDPAVVDTNAAAAQADESVPIEAPTLGKARTTLTTEAGNTDGQATIGEVVEYTVTLTVPEGTTVYDGALTDPVSARTTYLPASTTVDFDNGDPTDDPDTLPVGFIVGDHALTFPAVHENPAGSGDDVFTMTFQVRVDDEAANTRTSSNITNRARFDRNDSGATAFATLQSNQVATQVVEPVVTVAKAFIPAGPFAGGDTITYTVTVTNSSASRVSTAHDLQVVDTLPAGLTTVPPTGITDAGTYDAGAPQTITWDIASLAPGASEDLSYTITVSDSVIAGEDYVNDVAVDLFSLPEASTGERAYAAAADATVTAVGATITKTVTPETRTPGEASTYTLTVDIPANTQLFDAHVVDELPDGLRFDGYGTCTGDAGLCAALSTLTPAADTPAAGQTRIAWSLGDVASSPSVRQVVLTYDVEVALTDQLGDVVAGDLLDNQAGLGWNGVDGATITAPPALGDFDRDTGTVTARVTVTEPSLSIDKDVAGQVADTDSLEVDVNAALTYTVAIANASGATVSDAHDIRVIDTVPAGLVIDETSITGGGSYDGTASTITWVVEGPLVPGDSLSFTYDATPGDSGSISDGDTFANTAAIDEYFGVDDVARLAEPTEYRTYTGPFDTVTVTVDLPQLDVAKTSTGDATIGAPFTWTITVDNLATSAGAFGVDVVDTLPTAWTYTGAPALSVDGGPPTDPGAPSIVGQQLTWTDLADLPAGSTLVLTFQATPGFDARDEASHVNQAVTTADDADGNAAGGDGAYTASDTDAPTLVGSSLGDFVWEDLDGDGVQDGGEPGIEGVTVRLIAADGSTVLDTDTTDTAGAYGFDVLPAGTYFVEFVRPAGYTPTGVDAAAETVDSDAAFTTPDAATGRSPAVVLPANTDDPSIDAGFYRLVDLGDFVWEDVDGDGQFDVGEPAVAGATVTLRDSDGNVVDTPQTTGTDGAYLFTDLAPGDYTVTFTPPAGYAITTQNSGPDATDSDPDPITGVAAVSLVSNVDDLTVDAGLYVGAAIGDVVWFDIDGDGIQDLDEPGAPDVTVELLDTDGVPVGSPQLTDENGAYLFSGLAPGDYSVRFTAPDGTQFTLADEGGDDSLDSDVPAGGTSGTTPETTLASGETDRTWDAGLVGTGSLGDFVWEDLNGDGVQDVDEPGIEGALVTLTWAGPDGDLGTADDVEIGTETTGPDGLYGFDALPPGDYRVDVTPPAGGLVETVDLDDPDPADVTTPSTAVATLAPGQERLDVDFGYQRQADLGITKTVLDGDLLTGETAEYTIVVGNAGPAPAVGPIVVVDTAPAGLTPLTATSADTDWDCGIAGQVVTCTHPGPLANGDSLAAIATTARVEGDAAATLTNEAGVSSATADPNPANDTDDAEVATTQAADLTIDKSHATDAFVVGQTGSYTIVVANEGPSTALGTIDAPFTVTDTLPAGLTPTAASGTDWDCVIVDQTVTCTTTGTVADGSSLPAITITVDVGVAAEGGVTNTATVSGGATVDPNPDNDTDADPTAITPAADLSLTKAAQGDLVQDEEVDYLLTVTNDGPSSAAADIVIVDDLPTGLTFVSSASDDGFGCVDDAGTVTCTRTTALPAGETAAVTLTLYVEVDGPADITNAAVVSSPTLDPDPDNNSSSGDNPSTPQVDLVIDKSHAADFQVGSPGTWLLAVGNNGPSTSTGEVTVTDTLPAGVTPASVTSAGDAWACAFVGQDLTCTITATVGAGGSFPAIEVVVDVLPAAYPGVTNTAVVDGPTDVIDPVEPNDTDTDPTPVGALADLSLAKTALDDFVAGETGRYSLTVTNLGPNEDPATITVVDVLPTGVTFVSAAGDDWSCVAVDQEVTCDWTGGPLVVDASASVELTVAFDPSAQPGVENVAVVSSPTSDPDPDNDTASVTDAVAASADLAITKSSAGTVDRGEDLTWEIVVTNLGPSDDPGPITVTDTVPETFEIVSVAGDGWDCDVAGQEITCVRDETLMLGAAPTITVVATAGEGSEGRSTNTASVSSDTIDRDPTNDSSSDEVEVVPVVDLGLAKSLAGGLVAGDNATWVLVVTNDGLSPATGVTVVDTLPVGLTYVSSSGSGWSCTAAGQTVTCVLAGALEPGASSTLRLVTAAAATLSGSVQQQAAVSAEGVEADDADNADVVLAAVIRPSSSLPNTGAGTDTQGALGLALLAAGVVFAGAGRVVRRRASMAG